MNARLSGIPVIFLVLFLLLSISGCGGSGAGEGAPTITLTLEDIAGTWAGTIINNYYCEFGGELIELSISGSSLTVTSSTTTAVPVDTTGAVSAPTGVVFPITLDIGGPIPGHLFVDPTGRYASISIYTQPFGSTAHLGVLQKGAPASPTYNLTDLVGSWAGMTARFNLDFSLASTSDSSATIVNEGAIGAAPSLAITGMDDDGTLTGPAPAIVPKNPTEIVYNSAAGNLDWGGTSYGAIYAMTNDKIGLVVVFMASLCDNIFLDHLPAHKFAVWLKQ